MYGNYLAEDKPVRRVKVNPYTGYSSAVVADKVGTQEEPVDVFNDRGRPRFVRQKIYPKDSPPKTIFLPYLPAKRELGRYVEAEGNRHGYIKTVRARYAKQKIPTWLLPLEKDILETIMDLQTVLATVSDPCALVDQIYQLISVGLGIEVTRHEIGKVLLNVPYDGAKGASFNHFMFYMANFDVASKKVRKAYYEGARKNPPCEDYLDEFDMEEVNQGDSDGADRVYSYREQIFYSGLLIIEMYDTIESVEKLYFGNWIPKTVEAEAKQKVTFGRTTSAIGVKKRGVSEWNRVLPPIPKTSPYAAPMSFVTSRQVIEKPNPEQLGRRRTMTRIQPLYMVIEPPREDNQTARITVNHKRIRRVLEYLAQTGDCVALLPDIHEIIHLSDTFVKKLEDVSIAPSKPSPPQKKLSWENDFKEWIPIKPKPIHLPQAVSQQVAKVKTLIKFSDGVVLREILQHIHQLHWDYVNRKKSPTFEQDYKIWFEKLVNFANR